MAARAAHRAREARGSLRSCCRDLPRTIEPGPRANPLEPAQQFLRRSASQRRDFRLQSFHCRTNPREKHCSGHRLQRQLERVFGATMCSHGHWQRRLTRKSANRQLRLPISNRRAEPGNGRNSLSNSPCLLGRARGRGLIYSARTSNKPVAMAAIPRSGTAQPRG